MALVDARNGGVERRAADRLAEVHVLRDLLEHFVWRHGAGSVLSHVSKVARVSRRIAAACALG